MLLWGASRIDRSDAALVALFEIDEADALSGAAGFADVLGRTAHDHPLLGHDHQIVFFRHAFHADDFAVLVRDLDIRHAFAAAARDAVLGDFRALSKSFF